MKGRSAMRQVPQEILRHVLDLFDATGAKAQAFAIGDPDDPESIVGLLMVKGGDNLRKLQACAEGLQKEVTDRVIDARRDFK